MADSSNISWCDATMNPWVGCAKVSPACAHCYAETFAVNRMGLTEAKGTSVWGADAARRVTAASTWKKPSRWERLALEGLLPNGEPNDDGHRPRVFCASMADVFEERPDLEEPRRRLFDLIAATPSLDWLLLTKRPEFARAWLYDLWARSGRPEWQTRDGLGWSVLPNVWIGASIENARFTWRADILREIPAAVRFISAEPLLGSLYPAERGSFLTDTEDARLRPLTRSESLRSDKAPSERGRAALDQTGIDWVIVGGESGGRKSRPMHPEWAREIRDDAFSRGNAFHFKQHGSWGPVPPTSGTHPGDVCWSLDPPEKYVADANYVCASNESIGEWIRYYGAAPKSAGKALDGVEYCEFPGQAVAA